MNWKSITKHILSYACNPVALLRVKDVGRWIDIRSGLMVHGPHHIHIGNHVRIGRNARLSSYSGGGIFVEDGCSLGQHFSAIAGGDIRIKKNVLMASYISIVSENHGVDPEAGKSYGDQPLIKRDVEIGACCWLGEKVMILPGVTIGDWCVIGACSLVNKDIPPYTIAVGNPIRIIKKYNFVTHQWVKFNDN